MKQTKAGLPEIKDKIRKFVRERDWEKFHSPKNLSMSIAIEAAELMEHFQWLTIAQSKKLLRNKASRVEIEDELADIAVYVLDFCNLFDIDIEKSIINKLEKNAIKYPASKVKGKMHKYTWYQKNSQ